MSQNYYPYEGGITEVETAFKKIVNLTPHVIKLEGYGDILPEPISARCATTQVQVGEVAGVPVFAKVFGIVSGLPEPKEGVAYVVSAIVAQAVADVRDDVYVVNDTVRNSEGVIIGCKSLAVV